MCGICGIVDAHSLGTIDAKIFRELLFLSTFRGEDATGVFAGKRPKVDNNWGNIYTTHVKDALPAPLFIYKYFGREEGAHVFDNLSDTKFLVGHARSKTIGDNKVSNAHPFNFPNVIGVHNGTVSKNFKGYKDYETDSEGIYALLNDTDIETVLNEIQGFSSAYVFVYFDKRDKTLNIIRNKERPLYLAYRKGFRTLAFASEYSMVDMIVRQRASWDMSSWGKDDKGTDLPKIITLSENHLLSIQMTGSENLHISGGATYRELKIKKQKVYPVTSYYKGYDDIDWDQTTDFPKHKTKNQQVFDQVKLAWRNMTKAEKKAHDKSIAKTNSSTTKALALTKETRSLVAKDSWRKGFRGEYFEPSVYERIIKRGCCFCSTKPVLGINDPKFEESIHWYDEEEYACSDCLESSWVTLCYTEKVSVIKENIHAKANVNGSKLH